eukprot:2433662-Amphidinium_carterae.2
MSGENINIYGIKEVTLVHAHIAIPTTFIICDVNCAILGLDTVTTTLSPRTNYISKLKDIKDI